MGVVFVLLSTLQPRARKPTTSVADCPSGPGRAETEHGALSRKGLRLLGQGTSGGLGEASGQLSLLPGTLAVGFGILRSHVPSRAPRCWYLELGKRGTGWETVPLRCGCVAPGCTGVEKRRASVSWSRLTGGLRGPWPDEGVR